MKQNDRLCRAVHVSCHDVPPAPWTVLPPPSASLSVLTLMSDPALV